MASPWAGAGDAFGRLELWLYAALAGVLFRAPGTWLGFWTINHTGVQTYLIALTAMPFFAIALEASAAHLGWVAPPAPVGGRMGRGRRHPGGVGVADRGQDESATQPPVHEPALGLGARQRLRFLEMAARLA